MTVSRLVFVTGGARSGKSRFALDLAQAAGGDAVTFVATAEPLDAEMTRRIGHHRNERNPAWTTIEAPRDISAALSRTHTAVVVVDCLSLWVSNLMLDHVPDLEIVARAADAFVPRAGRLLIAVTNEVGFGIVPDNELARAYRDTLGRVSQTVAAAATEAHLLVAGLPLRLK